MPSPEVLGVVIAGRCAILAAVIDVRRRTSDNRRAAKARGRLRLACSHVEVDFAPDGGRASRSSAVHFADRLSAIRMRILRREIPLGRRRSGSGRLAGSVRNDPQKALAAYRQARAQRARLARSPNS